MTFGPVVRLDPAGPYPVDLLTLLLIEAGLSIQPHRVAWGASDAVCPATSKPA